MKILNHKAHCKKCKEEVIFLILFYIIQPILHYVGKKVTVIDLAKSSNDIILRKKAIKYLKDQSVLADFAKNDTDSIVRKAAVEKLIDQDLLVDVANNGKYSNVCIIAVEKLTDPSVLADIAKYGAYSDVCIAAAHSIINYDLEEGLLLDLIQMLKNELNNSDEISKINATDVLLAFYQRYGKNEHGKTMIGNIIGELNGIIIRTEKGGVGSGTQ